MESLDSLRQTLEACQTRFDSKINPAIEAADQAVQEYGFSSYMDLMAAMMCLSKTITPSTNTSIPSLVVMTSASGYL